MKNNEAVVQVSATSRELAINAVEQLLEVLRDNTFEEPVQETITVRENTSTDKINVTYIGNFISRDKYTIKEYEERDFNEFEREYCPEDFEED